MEIELKTYDVVLRDDDIGVECISWVDEPAINKYLMFFRDEQEYIPTKLIQSIEEKHEVVAPVLIPDMKIYRKATETKPAHFIRWSRETIEAVAVQMLLDQTQHNTSIMHPRFFNSDLTLEDSLVEDVYCMDMWIIEDTNDIAYTEYRFTDLPIGTLMFHYKIYNDELWNKIKTGEVKGMSVEAIMSMYIAQNKHHEVKTDFNLKIKNNKKINNNFNIKIKNK